VNNNKNINAIIVDDEQGCIANLSHYLNRLCPKVAVVGKGNTITEAMCAAGAQRIELAFLDIELYNENIFDAMARTGPPVFKVVFVTAYPQYALKAIKVEAIDYLLKPLSENEVQNCYTKIKRQFSPTSPDAPHPPVVSAGEKISRKIILKDLDRLFIISADDLCYISGSGFYSEITFMLNNEFKTITVSKPLNKLEEEYAFPFLFRVHKSHIVNINRIAELIRNDGLAIRMMDNELIQVAKRRSGDFIGHLNNPRS